MELLRLKLMDTVSYSELKIIIIRTIDKTQKEKIFKERQKKKRYYLQWKIAFSCTSDTFERITAVHHVIDFVINCIVITRRFVF